MPSQALYPSGVFYLSRMFFETISLCVHHPKRKEQLFLGLYASQ
jgi:hypothetical protein